MPEEKLADRLVRLARLDWSPEQRPPSPGALGLATLASLGGSLGADALLVFIGTRLFPSTRGFSHFHFSDYGTLTVIGVLVACAAWPVAARVSAAPRWLFFRLAILVTLVLFLPDCWILLRGEPLRGVAVLMAMHLAIALVTYNCLVRLAPVRPALAPSEAGPAKGEPPRPAPSRSPGQLAGWLGLLLGVEFVLGIVALFFLPAGRPSGWLPAPGRAVYLAHALVGVPLAIGAVALLPAVRGASRTLKVVAWLGFTGVALAGIGGILTSSHPLRLLGMALMLVGPMVAGLGYLIPALDRLPQETPGARPASELSDRTG